MPTPTNSGVCPRCRATLKVIERFCPMCGAELIRPQNPAPIEPLNTTAPSPPPNARGRGHYPLLALFVAILIPGAGQAYNGQPVKGFFLLFFSLLILPYLYSLVDAWTRARAIA